MTVRTSFIVTGVVALAAVTGTVTAIAAHPAPAGPTPVPRAWGWLVARQPSTFAYVPDALDQGNSGGHTNRVEHEATLGTYDAYFDEISRRPPITPLPPATAMSPPAQGRSRSIARRRGPTT